MTLIRAEKAHAINGVQGRMFALHVPPAPWKAGTFANQSWISESRSIKGYGKGAALTVHIRFDDGCRNGHNTFSITAEVREPGYRDVRACGCMHDDIAKIFPELAPLIIWHLCSTDGPMHYIANTIYRAGDRDHNGLLKGEKRQIRNGKTGQLAWQLVAIVDGEEVPIYRLDKNVDADIAPTAPDVRYVPWCRIGEGKSRELAHARSSACWPEATDEQLCLPKAELEALLTARLPALLVAMQRDIEAAGFLWSSAT